MQTQRTIQHSKKRPKKIPVSNVILTVLTVFLVFLVIFVTWVNLFLGTKSSSSNLTIPECEPKKNDFSEAKRSTPNNVAIPADNNEVMNDSTNATVMGMATGYNVGVYKRFVGSLRNSGYKGTASLDDWILFLKKSKHGLDF